MADDGIELIDGVPGPWRQSKASMEHEVQVRVVACDPSVESIF